MATYNVVLDASNSNTNLTLDYYSNGTADIINVYITVGYEGNATARPNILAGSNDTINFIIDPAYRPAYNVSLFYANSPNPAYLVLSGSPTYYVELNSGTGGLDNGEFLGTTNITSGPPPSWYVPPKDYTVEGTGGADVITTSYTGDPEGDRVDNSDAANGSQDDLIEAYGGNDYIDSQLGRDTVYGGTGNDTIYSGAGTDRVFGDSGNDTIYSGADADTVYGGTGNDTIDGGTGVDRLFGDAGDDRFLLTNNFGSDFIYGGETSESTGDVLDMSGLTTGVTVNLTSSNAETGTVNDGSSTASFYQIENIILGGGRDTVVLADGSGADSVQSFDMTDSGDGTTNDQLDVSGLTSDGGTTPVNTSDVVVTDTNGDGTGDAILTFPGGESITLIGVSPSLLDTPEELEAIGIPAAPAGIVDGTAGDDLIDTAYTGDPQGDMVDNNDATNGIGVAGSNEDSIVAGAGNDSISAGEGNDTIDGGTGNDSIDGGAGDDVSTGGAGDDTFVVSEGHDTITDFGTGSTNASDGDPGNNDFVDLTGHYTWDNYNAAVAAGDIDPQVIRNLQQWMQADQNDDGILNDTNAGWTVDDTLTIQNGGSAVAGSALTEETTGVGTTGEYSFSVYNLIGAGPTFTFDGTTHYSGDVTVSETNDAIFHDNGGGYYTNPVHNPAETDPDTGGALADQTITASTASTLQLGYGFSSASQFLLTGSDGSQILAFTTYVDTDGDGNLDTYSALTHIVTTEPLVDGVTYTMGNVPPGFMGSSGVGSNASIAGSLLATYVPPTPDGIVEGTAGDDVIDTAYTGDPDGDMVDNNDATAGIGAPGSNDDSITAGAGNDTVLAGDGSDTVDGGTGNDSIDGGLGNDTLIGGTGNDTLTGGDGDDVFVYQPGDGADVITDFGAGNTGAIDDGDQQNNDFVDLSAFYNSTTLADVNANGGNFASELGMLRADAADGTLDGIIDGVDYSAQIGDINLTLENAGVAVTGADLTFDNTNVVCFTSGTLIETDRGPIPIEDIKVGDLVLTKDDGLQPVRWIGSRKVGEDVLCQYPNLRPIRIAAQSLGCGLPKRDLLVSPQHRMLIRSQIADRMFGESEVLVAAKHLTAFDGIEIAEDQPTVTYWHFMFDRHQVVFAEGAESESLYAGKEALSSIPIESLREIHTLFPEVSEGKVPSPARKLVKGRQGRRLAERHHTNRRPLIQSTLPKPGGRHEVRI